MSLEGMDVERAQSIARQFDGSAQALARISGALAILTTELLFHWRGPASMTFEQQWTSLHQPALHAASCELADMHARLVANVAEQARASAVTGQGLLAAVDRVGTALERADRVHAGISVPEKLIHRIAGNSLITGRYRKTWTRWLRLNHDASFWKYKSSPVLHALHDNEWIQKASRFLDNSDVVDGMKIVDKVAIPLAVVAGTFEVGQSIVKVADGQYLHAAGYALDAIGTGLVAIPTPPTMIIGAGIIVARTVPWDKVFAAASEYTPSAMSMFADLPTGLPNKLQEMF